VGVILTLLPFNHLASTSVIHRLNPSTHLFYPLYPSRLIYFTLSRLISGMFPVSCFLFPVYVKRETSVYQFLYSPYMPHRRDEVVELLVTMHYLHTPA
jgi:hypothetical protein